MRDWIAFLASVAKKASVAAAQQGVAVAVGGGPQGAAAGAAAGAIVDSLTTELLGAFVEVQAEQFARLEKLNREMNGRLLALQQDVQTLLDGPLLEARLLLEQAAVDRTVDRRQQDLLKARDAFFRAFSLAQTDGRRALIAEQLAVVYVLDGDSDRGRAWISDALTFAANAVYSQYVSLDIRLIDHSRQAGRQLLVPKWKQYEARAQRNERGIPVIDEMQALAFLDLLGAEQLIQEVTALREFVNYCNGLRQSCQAFGADLRRVPEFEIEVHWMGKRVPVSLMILENGGYVPSSERTPWR